MIVEALMNALVLAINSVLKLVPPLPSFPDVLNYSLDRFFDLVFDNLVLLDVFLPINLIKICGITLLSVISFCYLFSALKHILYTLYIRV